MKLQLKNISGVKHPVADLGIELATGEIREIYTNENDFEFSMNEIISSIDLQNSVLNDKIVIRNGIIDLPKQDALNLLTGVTLQDFIKDSYQEIIRVANKISKIIIWNNSSKELKYKEYTFTRSNNFVTQINLKIYNSNELVEEINSIVDRANGVIGAITEVIA